MKRIFLFTLTLILPIVCYSQSSGEQQYQRAKIYLEDHRILKVKDLRLNSIEAIFTDPEKRTQKIPLNSIASIRVPKGSHWWQGTLIGLGSGAITALLIDLQPDPLGIERERGAEFYIGFTAGGALLGALIGTLFPKWKHVYYDGKFIGHKLPFKLDFHTQKDNINFKITIPL
ncbi:hypothetical protein GWK08_00655 [Leptobacterium flavescens]|uniref:Uncharacterized protein n=1 Tax=Leptobacterium flavescens TaxID=472055 RepID=A0A6P0UNN2_9FLAO|nr:hypothetical protein [Leptobacterium flavescens]NER11936.1 hypothetical protein [Leptobacterium flavescens]